MFLLQVDGDTSTNDTVIALASGLSESTLISSLKCEEAIQLQACLDVVCLVLNNSFLSLSFMVWMYMSEYSGIRLAI